MSSLGRGSRCRKYKEEKRMNQETIRRWAKNPYQISVSMAKHGWLNSLPDKQYLSLMYRGHFGAKMNWENPVNFSEKLQWLKLYDRKPVYTQMVDKYEAKWYVSERIGEEYIVPVVGGPWDDPDQIEFDRLPDQFVLKTTHDCGGVWICRDKSKLDIPAAKAFLRKHLNRDYYLSCREWPYKDVKPRIFAEAYLSGADQGEGLWDYKFFTFNGEPKLMYIARGRDYSQKDKQPVYADFFDMDFQHVDLCIDHDNAPVPPERPEHFEGMVSFARKLAQGTKHLRVDFYEANGALYSGELTFFHCGGFQPFHTPQWEPVLGSWICLE